MSDDSDSRKPGVIHDSAPEELQAEQEKILGKLKREKARVRRLVILVPVLWVLFILFYFGLGALDYLFTSQGLSRNEISYRMGWYLIPVFSTFVAAFVCTVSLVIRSRLVKDRQITALMTSIERFLQELRDKR